ncbi:MAG: CehA/McbA family metallohydrolase [Candidatus Solibacter usitatus]|nr:CehA/McbA family metallohydrolase [Candidatus Solibacter usitatus]
MKRGWLVAVFGVALAWTQYRESGLREIAGHLELATEPLMPARVYLFKDGKPFRLSPVDAMLPLRVDLFYRERLWRRGANPSVLEVTCNDISHFFLLKGRANFDLPAGNYRVEAYRGLFYKPFSAEFTLEAGKQTRAVLKMEDWTAGEGAKWISSDDHIHLVRDREDDAVFLSWMDAEDLTVANFLQLQRQMDAASQYGYGPQAEAKRGGRSIRPGHESRSAFFGHVNVLGGREMIRPLSLGTVYSNSPETFPYPYVLFGMGRKLGALVGYAHFDGSQKNSALLMDLALGNLDFAEVFQFGRLRTEQWYELLNAGFRLTGVAGSDFPVNVNNATKLEKWSRWIPLLGPERMLVKAAAGTSAYETWAAAVKRGEGVVTNGPLIELRLNEQSGQLEAEAKFYRPMTKLEIVANGKVIASAKAGASLRASASIPPQGPVWVAARALADPDVAGTTEIQAHTNPRYMRWDGSAPDSQARRNAADRWRKEVEYYRTAPLVFPSERERARFFELCEVALKKLTG